MFTSRVFSFPPILSESCELSFPAARHPSLLLAIFYHSFAASCYPSLLITVVRCFSTSFTAARHPSPLFAILRCFSLSFAADLLTISHCFSLLSAIVHHPS